MIAVEADNREIRVSISTQGMPAEAVSAFVEWLRVEAVARRSRMTEGAAWQLAEDVKTDWWARNHDRFTGATGE